jgi:hypothetical protein
VAASLTGISLVMYCLMSSSDMLIRCFLYLLICDVRSAQTAGVAVFPPSSHACCLFSLCSNLDAAPFFAKDTLRLVFTFFKVAATTTFECLLGRRRGGRRN